MANEIDDGEFWLPSEFLTDDDILSDFNSDPSSPVLEPDSDEDEFLAELTRRMSRIPKILSGSPQSTLFPLTGSNLGSPAGPVSPPPAAANEGYFVANDAASFDLLYAAAGEVAKLRSQSEQKGTGYFDSSRGFLYPRPDFNAFLSHQQFQLQQLWRKENAAAAFPPLQRQQPTGTGVFLPRRVNNAAAEPPRIRNNRAVRSHGKGPRRGEEKAVGNNEIQLPSEWTY